MRTAFDTILIVILMICVCSCSQSDVPKDQPSETPSVVSEDESIETSPPASTEETEPASTAISEPEPEPLPEPEPEPEPEPLKIPEPVVYTGSGDDVLEVDPFDGVHVFYISGNQESRHFSVKGYNASGKSTGLFVNTSDPYSGITIDPKQETTTFEISASGDWTIEIRSIHSMRTISADEKVEGSGDDVLEVSPFDGVYVFYISGNQESKHFSVKGYNASGKSTGLFVNTSDPYSGITIDPEQATTTFEIIASGDWTIELRSIYSMRTISTGETVEGIGDEILLVSNYGATSTIDGNQSSKHFAVKSYGKSNALLVNTSDPYSGKVMLKGEPVILEITATGEWAIAFN